MTQRSTTQRDARPVTQGGGGSIERQVRDDIAALKLRGTQRTIAEIIYALARDLDSGASTSPASVARQIAQLIADLERIAEGEEESAVDAIVHSVADELAPRRRAVAPPGA